MNSNRTMQEALIKKKAKNANSIDADTIQTEPKSDPQKKKKKKNLHNANNLVM